MLEQFRYQNHLGEVFEFGKDGIFVDTNDLHDYEWDVTRKGNRINRFDRSTDDKKIPVKIICKTDELGVAARNKLHEVTEKDVLAGMHGKILIGDYYYKCFVTKSEKSSYLLSKCLMDVKLTLSTDHPAWVRESMHAYRKTGMSGNNAFFDYSFDYPHDYTAETASGTLVSGAIADSNFRMIIHGTCINPIVYINGHAYGVRCTVGAGEYLTIDSVTKKIFLTAVDGTVTNLFNRRNRESYIFKPIPPGQNNVTWEGNCGIDIVLIEERSEPKWT